MIPASNFNFTQEEMFFIVNAFAKKRNLSSPNLFALEEQTSALHPSSQKKNCSSCSKSTTSKWYKDPSDEKKDLCQRCYEAQQRALPKAGVLGRTCSTPSCQTSSTLHWYKNPSDKEKDLCQRCYQAQRRAFSMEGMSGKICSISSCQATSTTQWCKDLLKKKNDVCNKCYQAQRKVLNRNKSPLEPNLKRSRFS